MDKITDRQIIEVLHWYFDMKQNHATTFNDSKTNIDSVIKYIQDNWGIDWIKNDK